MAWVVLIERVEGAGNERHWRMGGVHAGPFDDFGRAVDAAVGLTRDYRPPHPWSEQGRRAYRITPNEYLVSVAGFMSEFHFRVTVAEAIEPGTGRPV